MATERGRRERRTAAARVIAEVLERAIAAGEASPFESVRAGTTNNVVILDDAGHKFYFEVEEHEV